MKPKASSRGKSIRPTILQPTKRGTDVTATVNGMEAQDRP